MNPNKTYVHKLMFKNKNISNIKMLRKGGYSKTNIRRGTRMHQYGSTLGYAKTPRIIKSLCPLKTIM